MADTLIDLLPESGQPASPRDVNLGRSVMNGLVGAAVLLAGSTGRRRDNALTTNYALEVQSQATGGLHAAFVLSGTATSTAKTIANSVLLIEDAGVRLGAGIPLSIGSIPATGGAIRLPNNVGIYSRNAGNTANVLQIGLDAANNVLVGDNVQAGTATLQALTNTYLRVGATDRVIVSTTGVQLVGTLALDAGVIATAALAANAVTQAGVATPLTAGPTTASTSYVDLTNMSVTLTTTGGPLLVWANLTSYNSGVGNTNFMALSLDGAAEVAEVSFAEPTINFQFPMSTQWLFTGVAAGSHTVKSRWKTSGGTASNLSLQRGLMVVELKR